MIRRVVVFGLSMCTAVSCHEATPAKVASSRRDTSRLTPAQAAYYLDPSEACGYLARDMNPDPVALVREYVGRDNLGEFLQGNAWLDSAYVCPDHLPGPDSFTVVEASKIVGQQLTDSSAHVFVEFAVIGEMTQDSIGFVFLRGAKTKVDTFIVDHTPNGWRITAPGLPENVGAAWVLSHPERISLRSDNHDSLVVATRSVTPNDR